MTMRHSLLAPLALTLLIGLAGPIRAADATRHDTRAAADEAGKKDELPIPPERSVVTSHDVTIGGRSVAYKATAGTLLHMGSSGPVRVANQGDKPIPPPPYATVFRGSLC